MDLWEVILWTPIWILLAPFALLWCLIQCAFAIIHDVFTCAVLIPTLTWALIVCGLQSLTNVIRERVLRRRRDTDVEAANGVRDEETEQAPQKKDVVRLKSLKTGAWLEKLRRAEHTQAPQTHGAGTSIAVGVSVMGAGDMTAAPSANASSANCSEFRGVSQKPALTTIEDDRRNRVDGRGS